ncbi:hypothetical protein [Bacillus sp. JCM 19034]|uniref:hypothetical protein n=1 Tax=Bacillus sp. JCM 19034 TaxID=1481928 RepID=UPI00078474DB|nr:hypothetical protein [Bacillus sp. JCM 19034]
MKKLSIMLLMFTFLFGCSNDNSTTNNVEEISEDNNTPEETDDLVTEEQEPDEIDEVTEFVKRFNELASLSDEVNEITDSNEIDETGARMLYASNNYGVIAIYNEEKILDNYSVVFSKEEPYQDLQGVALNTALHIGSILDLDLNKFAEEFENSLSKDFHSYFEDDFLIAFFNHKISGQSDFGMVVEFSLP